MDRNGDFLHFFDLLGGLAGGTSILSTVFHRGPRDLQRVHQLDEGDLGFLQRRDTFAPLQQQREKTDFNKLAPGNKPTRKLWTVSDNAVTMQVHQL